MTLRRRSIIIDDFRHSLNQTDEHDKASKDNTHPRCIRLPRPRAKFDIAERRQYICEGTGGRSTDEFKDSAEVASEERDEHGAEDERC